MSSPKIPLLINDAMLLKYPFRYVEKMLNQYIFVFLLFHLRDLIMRSFNSHLIMYSFIFFFSAVLISVFSVLILRTTLFVDSWFNDGSLVGITHDVIWSWVFFLSFLRWLGDSLFSLSIFITCFYYYLHSM